MGTPTVISLEFNELTPPLIERFWRQGELPNFRRFFSESHCFTTDAEERGEALNPWIQWVTVHTGVPYAEHQVFRLNEAGKVQGRQVWDILSEAGHRSWICGSMNTSYRPDFDGLLVPDPWTSDTLPRPAELTPYVDFVRHQVQEHTNANSRSSLRALLGFVTFMVRHGLSPETVAAIVRQLISERVDDVGWKRASLLDRLQFDLFSWYFRRYRPAFASFFLNSTAHYQHVFWREMEPEAFDIQPSDRDRKTYGSAVLYGYRQMDRLLGKFMALADGNTTLMLTSALSQQPCMVYDASGGKRFYRPKGLETLLTRVGIDAPVRVSPVMSEQFHLYFEEEQTRDAALAALSGLKVGDEPLLGIQPEGARELFLGCRLFGEVASDAVIASGDRRLPFFELFYEAGSRKSGMHHPEGFCWVRTPEKVHVVHERPVSLRAIAPTVLTLFGVDVPPAMRAAPLDIGIAPGNSRSAPARAQVSAT